MTETTKLSGNVAIERVAPGSRSEHDHPVLTLDDGTRLLLDVPNANPFYDEDLHGAAARIQREGRRVENLEGTEYRGHFIIKSAAALLKAAGIEPEQPQRAAGQGR